MIDGTRIPLPSVAARRGPFRVRDRDGPTGCCASPSGGKSGVFEAPFSDASGESLAVRQHEYGHLAVDRLAIVPAAALRLLPSFFSIAEPWIQAALDVVVNAFMANRGNPEIRLLEPVSGPLAGPIPRWEAACLFLRCEGLECQERLRPQLASLGRFTIEETGLLERFAAKLAWAGTVSEKLTLLGLRRDLKRLQRVFGPAAGDPATPRAVPVMGAVDGSIHSSMGLLDPGPTPNIWGEMEIHTPPLEAAAAPRSRTLAWKPAYAGPLIFPHRALLPGCDGRAFGARKRGTRGSVLIDCSGSMNLSGAMLARVLEAAPTAVVALYASRPRDMRFGRLIVAARNGRRLAGLEAVRVALGSGNVVDGPALRYLISECGPPRFWISDGLVTGRGDRPAANLTREAGHLADGSRVRRFGSIDEFLAALPASPGVSARPS